MEETPLWFLGFWDLTTIPFLYFRVKELEEAVK